MLVQHNAPGLVVVFNPSSHVRFLHPVHYFLGYYLNRACPIPGPGRGVYGRPGREGENCVPQGNVLIIQESNKSEPDSNAKGGVICFSAVDNGTFDVLSIGLMGIPRGPDTFIEVLTTSSVVPTRFNIMGLGRNSVQTVDINLDDATKLCVYLPGEGAITSITVCGDGRVPSASPSLIPDGPIMPPVEAPVNNPAFQSPIESLVPSLSPAGSPPFATMTDSPTDEPSSFSSFAPTQICADLARIDFEKSGNGTLLDKGDYVSDDWSASNGVFIEALATCGGYTPWSKARIFDTAKPGKHAARGDPDLGSPNM